MLELLSVGLFLVVFLALVSFVTTFRPLPISGALPVAFSGVICLESILLNILGIFQSVTRSSVLSSHVFLLIIWIIWLLGFEQKRHLING